MYRVSKILNNNGVIAINTEDNQEYVLLGKGIGFGKKVSQRFEVTEDTATYRLTEQTDRGSAKSLVQEMDPEFLEIARPLNNSWLSFRISKKLASILMPRVFPKRRGRVISVTLVAFVFTSFSISSDLSIK